MTTNQTRAALSRYHVYVSNGYAFEYETTIEASSVADARRKWKARGDYKTVRFQVSKEKDDA